MTKIAYLKTRPLPPNLKYRILGPISEAEFQKILRAYGVVPSDQDDAVEGEEALVEAKITGTIPLVELKKEREIEITPAMLKAGLSPLCGYEPDWVSPSETVKEIYKAMRRLET